MKTKYTGDAIFGIDGDDSPFRYRLSRSTSLHGIGSRQPVGWVMLNPSSATELENDPTINRVEDFSFRRWGFTQLMVGNIGAFRTEDPKKWRAATDPFGPRNDDYLSDMGRACEFIVCAWGQHGRPRQPYMLELLKGFDLRYLRLNRDGTPAHPLYLPSTLKPEKWIP